MGATERCLLCARADPMLAGHCDEYSSSIPVTTPIMMSFFLGSLELAREISSLAFIARSQPPRGTWLEAFTGPPPSEAAAIRGPVTTVKERKLPKISYTQKTFNSGERDSSPLVCEALIAVHRPRELLMRLRTVPPRFALGNPKISKIKSWGRKLPTYPRARPHFPLRISTLVLPLVRDEVAHRPARPRALFKHLLQIPQAKSPPKNVHHEHDLRQAQSVELERLPPHHPEPVEREQGGVRNVDAELPRECVEAFRETSDSDARERGKIMTAGDGAEAEAKMVERRSSTVVLTMARGVRR